MKKNHWIMLSIGLAFALGFYVVPGITQAPPQQQSALPHQVAVVDLAQIIRAHPGFMQQQEALQAEVRQAEAHFQQRQDELEEKQQGLRRSTLNVQSPEYQQALDTLTREIAAFEADVRAQHRRFTLRNSQIMYETHKDILMVIGAFAQRNGFAQVTDYRFMEVDPGNPESVAENMDQRLVWFDPRLNMTNFIIHGLYTSKGMQVPAAIAERHPTVR